MDPSALVFVVCAALSVVFGVVMKRVAIPPHLARLPRPVT